MEILSDVAKEKDGWNHIIIHANMGNYEVPILELNGKVVPFPKASMMNIFLDRAVHGYYDKGGE
jgi:hypothetical protein